MKNLAGRMLTTLSSWSSIIIYLSVLTILVVLLRGMSVNFLAFLAPNESDALNVMWQVHAAVVSIGFTGLAITFQLLADPPISAGPARRAVIRRLHFSKLLAVGVFTDVTTGAAAIWFHSDANVILLFIASFVPSLLAIVATYWYSAYLFGHPHMVEQFTVDDVISAVRGHTQVVANNRRQSIELLRVVESLHNLTPIPQIATANKDRSLGYTGPSGVVRQVNFDQLRNFSHALSQSMVSETSEQEAPNTPSAHIRVQIGDRVTSASIVADLYYIGEIKERTSARLSKLLSRSLIVADASLSAEELLERELEDLQADVIVAIRDKRYSAAERGFGYYSAIISEIREVATEQSHEQILGFGDGWEHLTKHLWELNDISAKEDARMAVLATEAAYHRCNDALRHANVEFFASALQSYFQIWTTCLTGTDAREGALEHLLVSLQNLTEYTIRYRSMGTETTRKCIELTMITWLDIIQHAYTEGSDTWSSRSLGFHAGMFRFESGPERHAGEVQQALLELLAWMLYKHQVLHIDTNFAVKEILSKLRNQDALKISVAVTRRKDHPNLRHWETARSLPLEVTQLRSSEFLSQAAILFLSKFPSSPPASPSRDDYDFAQYALTQVGAIRDAWQPDWEVPISALDHITSILQEIITRWRRSSQRALLDAPLEEERVAEFTQAITKELARPGRVISILDTEIEESEDYNEKKEFFGQKLLVPKDYFVHTDVLADPASLGAQVGRGIRQGETAGVLRKCLQFGESRKVTISELPDFILNWTSSAASPFVLVANSYEAYSVAESSLAGESTSTDNGNIPVLQIYSDEIEEQVVLIDTSRAPRVRRRPELKDGLTALSEHALSVGVYGGGVNESDGTPLATIEFGSRATWLMPAAGKVLFIYVPDITY